MINYYIWCFCSFFHFLLSDVPDNKCYKQKWRMLFFTLIKSMARVVVCAHTIACIKYKRLYHFRLNLSLVLLIKVMIIKKHLMLFFSYLKCRYNFLTWVFLVFLFFILYFIWTILSEKGRGRLKTGFLKST